MNDYTDKDVPARELAGIYAHKRATKFIFALLVLLVVAIILWAVVSLVLLFFSVEEIAVYGDSRYTDEEIILSSGIEIGDRVYYLNEKKAKDALLSAYPYLEDVEIKGYFPNKAVIEIKEYDTVYITEHESGFCCFNEYFEIIEIVDKLPDLLNSGHIRLYLENTLSGNVGDSIPQDQSELIENTMESLEGFEEIDRLNRIDLRDRHNIAIVFAHNCRIIIGGAQGANEKLALALRIYNSGDFNKNDYSIIDVTNDKKVVLRYVDKKDFEK